ncbi:MAG: PTS fructose transporter subunit IIABC [Brevinema sp.]
MRKFFDQNLILLDSDAQSKDAILSEMATLFTKQGYSNNEKELLKALRDREAIDPTIIAENIAMPHAKSSSVSKVGVIIIRTKNPVIWNEKSGDTASLFFMIGIPEKENSLHLSIISGLSEILSEDTKVQTFLTSSDKSILLNLFNERKHVSAQKHSLTGVVDIVAVTACPTGIAHTYMAADALKKIGAIKDLHIRVETNGSDGVKDTLTDAEIKNAKVVILAVERDVDMSRFDGKKLYKVSAGHTVRNPNDVVQKALQENVPIYKHQQDSSSDSSHNKKGVYGQLMTGVSYMLPFVVGGGILIAIGFMFGITAHDPNATDYNPIAKFLNTLGGAGAFSLMIPILAGYIGFSIGERPALMPAMVGGSLAASSGGGFLGGLLAGFVGGYVILVLKKVFSPLPKVFNGIKPVLLYPVFGLLLMGIIVMPLLGLVSQINGGISQFLESLSSTNLALLGLLLGGMMAIDMGGPINKAAFTFGIAAISAGNLYPHAAVMAGGMTPPLGVALATTFAKHFFTQDERETGITCYALGASFITEGVLPFAASKPLIIIPSCVLGSAVAGALSMMFSCQLPAPHGGIFVFPLITNLPGYLISLTVGSIITALSIVILLSRQRIKKT